MTNLTTAAIRGTAQSNINRVEPGTESDVLFKLGLRDAQRRAGYVAKRTDEGLSFTPFVNTELDVICEERVIELLPFLIQDEFHNLLHVVVEKLHHAGQRLPDEWLPIILEIGNKKLPILMGRRSGLLPTMMGERSRWLAAVSGKANWQWVNDEDTTLESFGNTKWQNIANEADQVIAFQQLRQLTPALARQQLLEKWAAVNINNRDMFIAALRCKLSMDDEPLLWDFFNQPNCTKEDAQLAYMAAHLMSSLRQSRFVKLVVPQMITALEFTYREETGRHHLYWNIKALKQQTAWFNPMMYKSNDDLHQPNKVITEQVESDFLSLLPLSALYQYSNLTREKLIQCISHDENILRIYLKRTVIDSDTRMAYVLLNHFMERGFDRESIKLTQSGIGLRRMLRRLSFVTNRADGKPLIHLITWEQFISFINRWVDVGRA